MKIRWINLQTVDSVSDDEESQIEEQNRAEPQESEGVQK